MKTRLCMFLILFTTALPCFAEVPIIPAAPAVTPQNAPKVSTEPKPAVVMTNFENCVKTYNTSVENLFYLTLAAINANNYKIDEIQSRTGLISFLAGNKSLLASVTAVNGKTSMIKITPVDNSYTFSPVIPERIFMYLTNNVK